MILIHAREAQKRIATGRISHLCLKDSELIQGYDYSDNLRVNELIQDNNYQCYVLYPGADSINISNSQTQQLVLPEGKRLLIFVIDGTWTTARKTMQRSKNLQKIQKICFIPQKPSEFKLRKQPKPNFYSTIEAIHETIEILGTISNYNVTAGTHHRLLEVFKYMVEQQIELSKKEKLYCQWKPKKKKQDPSFLSSSQP